MFRHSPLTLLLAFLLACCAGPSAGAHAHVGAFEQADWERRVTEGWNRKDLKLLAGTLSALFSDGGMSKADAVRLAADLFGKYEKISSRYRVLWFRQFPDPRLASVKMVMEVKGVPAGGRDFEVIRQTMGYHSLIFEDGEWRMYGVMFFCDPRIPNFNFEKERGHWPRFDVQMHLLTYDPEGPARPDDRGGWVTEFAGGKARPARGGRGAVFDKDEWERRVVEGWNKKDSRAVLSSFSKLYNEVGVSIEDVVKPVTLLFEKFDKLHCRYRVLAFKQFPGTNLASVKAVMELSGVPAGGKEYVKFIETMGYASLIHEDGEWKMYTSQLIYSPKVPRFDFDKEKGDWPPWGTVVDLSPEP